MSNSLWCYGLQHTRLPCPSPTPRAYSNSRPLSQWCHPTISSSVIPFSSCLQSFPATGSFPLSQFFTSRGQNIGASASADVLPMNTEGWFPLGLTGWISLLYKGPSSIFSNTTVQKYQLFCAQLYFWFKSHIHTDLCQQSNVSVFLICCHRLAIAFLPRSKCLLISWAQSLLAVILEPRKIKSVTGGEFWQTMVHWRREWQTTSVFWPW